MLCARTLKYYSGLWCNISALILCIFVKYLPFSVVSAQSNIHYINWNTTNPLFRDYGNNIININAGTEDQPWRYEQANIICPRYSSNVPTSRAERYIIYNVSRTEFEHCQVNDPQQNKIVAICNTPYELTFFTLTFRAFSPVPGAFEFHPGENYYFISTSSKRNLHKHAGGKCATHNMKLMFRIRDTNHGNTSSIRNKENVDDFLKANLKKSEQVSEFSKNQRIEDGNLDYNEYYNENEDYYSNNYKRPEPVQSNAVRSAVILYCDPVISITLFMFTNLVWKLIL